MTLDDWLIALHLLSAFAFMGALTIFSIGMVALRSVETPARALAFAPAMKVAKIAVGVGIVGTLVSGIWLALSLDAYQVWDLWVILAIVGWAISTELGRRVGLVMDPAFARAATLVAEGKDSPDAELVAVLRDAGVRRLHWLSTAAGVLVLLDMIWKPGA